MTCPDGYRVRPVTTDDLDRVVELLNHDATAVTGFPVTWRALLKASWENPAVELGNDMFVVVEDASGVVVAYSELFGREPYVDPIIIGSVDAHDLRRGLGSFLIEEGARRAERFVAKAPPDRAVVLRVDVRVVEPRSDHVRRRALRPRPAPGSRRKATVACCSTSTPSRRREQTGCTSVQG